MKEWRSKLFVSLTLGVAAAALLVRAAHRSGDVLPPAPSASAVPATVIDANAYAAPLDARSADADWEEASAADAADLCARFAERSAAALSGVRGRLHEANKKLPELCVTTPRATWALVVEHAAEGSPSSEPDGTGVGIAVALLHIDANARETRVLPSEALHDTWSVASGSFIGNVSLAPSWGSVDLTLLTAYDYDGDGDPEIVLEGTGADEGPDRNTTEAWTFRDGKIIPFAPLAAVTILRVEDLDHDARPDLITRGPYAGVRAVSGVGGDYPIAPPFFAMHSLPGGVFSRDDAVARAFGASHCAAKPTLDLTGPNVSRQFTEDVAERVVCAKLWGATAAEIRRAWDKVCAGVDAGNDYECQTWPKELGAIAPPFVLK